MTSFTGWCFEVAGVNVKLIALFSVNGVSLPSAEQATNVIGCALSVPLVMTVMKFSFNFKSFLKLLSLDRTITS